jgi:histidyl-tRNA synthetase
LTFKTYRSFFSTIKTTKDSSIPVFKHPAEANLAKWQFIMSNIHQYIQYHNFSRITMPVDAFPKLHISPLFGKNSVDYFSNSVD